MNLTGSTYEYMMREPGREKTEGRYTDGLPSDHPCYGCPYAVPRPCIGYCLKKLMKKKEE